MLTLTEKEDASWSGFELEHSPIVEQISLGSSPCDRKFRITGAYSFMKALHCTQAYGTKVSLVLYTSACTLYTQNYDALQIQLITMIVVNWNCSPAL